MQNRLRNLWTIILNLLSLPRKEEKQYGHQIDPFLFLKIPFINKRWTFISAMKKDSTKLSKVTLRFCFLQYGR